MRVRGFTLIEFLVALVIGMATVTIYMSGAEDRVNQSRSDLVVRETADMMNGFRRWVADNDGALPGGASCAAALDIVSSAGYFVIADTTNSFGANHIVTCSGRTIFIRQNVPEAWGLYAASQLSGAEYAAGVLTIRFPAGSDHSIITGNVVHRDAVAGRPELNVRAGAIDFGGTGDLTNVSSMTAREFAGRTLTATNVNTRVDVAGGATTTTIYNMRVGELADNSPCGHGYCPPGIGTMNFAGDLTLWSAAAQPLYVKGSDGGWSGSDLPTIAGASGVLITPGSGYLRGGGQYLVFSDGTNQYPATAFLDSTELSAGIVPAGTGAPVSVPSLCSGWTKAENPTSLSGSESVGSVQVKPWGASTLTLRNSTPTARPFISGCQAPGW